MLSILIPSYDNNVVPLFEELHKQLAPTAIEFEIICIDNASKSEKCVFNQSVNKMPNSRYLENEKDVGRSAIRNQLASAATGDWLLFLDDDVLPAASTFIALYVKVMQEDAQVICGGLRYSPFSKQKNTLRYQYGKRFEEVSVEKRANRPYKYFLASNLLIKKTVFESVRFNESITQYGYEDLLFAKDLQDKQIPIRHTANPVFHLGIDSNGVFVQKTEQAIRNMVGLSTNGILQQADTGILETYQRCKGFGLLPIIRILGAFCKGRALKGSLFFFNLYRLSYLAQLLNDSK